MSNLENQEKMLDLLAEREIYGLSREDEKELEQILQSFPEWRDDKTFGLTVAAVALATVKTDAQMPFALRAKILDDSERFFANRENEAHVLDYQPEVDRKARAETEVSGASKNRERQFLFWNWTGWAVAAVACIALAVNLWRVEAPSENARNQPAQQQNLPPSLAEQRQQLLAEAPDAIQTDWSDFNPKQPRNVKGDVVWSNSLQKGFLRFRNLPANDKTKETYQLWIFDANQNAKTPIDGGVFDVDASGDVIIPIDAKIKVQKPTMFAVTAEKPGGVVVSELGKVIAVAKIET